MPLLLVVRPLATSSFLLLAGEGQEPPIAMPLLLVVRPLATSSFLLLVVRPGAPNSDALAPSSKALGY